MDVFSIISKDMMYKSLKIFNLGLCVIYFPHVPLYIFKFLCYMLEAF